MRGTFIKTLAKLAEQDPRILLLTGDLGYTVLEPFSERFPDRFFNVGVAEQNLVGLATGLAEAGFIPFLYSIATFISLRAYEFIRNGPVLHNLPVRIIGVGGGFEYGPAGTSHHALEDIGVMRIQPDIRVIVPADYQQSHTALIATWNLPGPTYYRLGKDEKNLVPGLDGRFELERAQFIGKGSDLLLICTGGITNEVVTAVQVLTTQGIACTVMVIASLNPSPVNDLIEVLSRFKMALTVEEHYSVGGISSLVSEVIAEQGLNCQLVLCGVKTTLKGRLGGQNYLRNKFELSSQTLVVTAIQALKRFSP